MCLSKTSEKWVILIALQFRYTFYRPQTKRLRARKINSFIHTKLLWTLCNKLQHRKGSTSPGGGVTWVNFFWICAAGLSDPLTHYSLFCGQFKDFILVTFEKEQFS